MAIFEKRKTKTGYTWTTRIDVGVDPKTGKRRQKRVSARTRKELEAKVAELRHKVHTGAYVETSKRTLADYLESEWLVMVARTVRPSTLRVYRAAVENHITPSMGNIRLGRLTPANVDRFYTDKLDAGLSPATVKKLHAILHRALADALRLGYVGRNVCQFVQPPTAKPPEMTTWTIEQAQRFLSATEEHPLGLLWHAGLITGMRVGELIALRWMDVDLRRRQLAVRQTLTRDERGRDTFGPPKSNERVIALPSHLAERLVEAQADQRRRYADMDLEWTDEAFVFDRGDGGYTRPSYIASHFRRECHRAGVPRIRLHDLRHSSATILVASGVNVKVVQERLGHHSAAFTLDRYAHVTESMQAEAARNLAEMLGFEAGCDHFVTETPVGAEFSPLESGNEK